MDTAPVPMDIVEVPKDDLRVGDELVFLGRYPHRIIRLDPYVGSNIAVFGAGTRVAICADGFEMTLTSAYYEILRRPTTRIDGALGASWQTPNTVAGTESSRT